MDHILPTALDYLRMRRTSNPKYSSRLQGGEPLNFEYFREFEYFLFLNCFQYIGIAIRTGFELRINRKTHRISNEVLSAFPDGRLHQIIAVMYMSLHV